MQTKELLIKAKALIDTPEKWCQEYLATDANGHRVDVKQDTACSFCSYGALIRAEPDHFDEAHQRAEQLLEAAADSMGSISYILFNDNHTHAEVMQMWDKAIQNAT